MRKRQRDRRPNRSLQSHVRAVGGRAIRAGRGIGRPEVAYVLGLFGSHIQHKFHEFRRFFNVLLYNYLRYKHLL
jgi:hypothetical protein